MTWTDDPVATILKTQPFVMLDGGLATELERLGADLNDPLWSAKILVEAPDLIERVHYDYFLAGADVAITASYQATFEGFHQRGIDRAAAADLMRLSVHLARDARGRILNERPARKHMLIAASIGSYGAAQADGSEYRGDYGMSVSELVDFHRPRAEVLVDTNPDLLACETIPCQVEAEALVLLLEEFPDARAWLSFSCRDAAQVHHGESLAECVAVAGQSPQVVAIGINCTAPRHVMGLVQAARPATTKPIVCYPNSGESWDASEKGWVDDADGADFAWTAPRWYDAGARLLGGCCRTTPTTIQAMSASLREHVSRE